MPKIADIEPTPNPNAMKFILREPLTIGGSRSFDRPSDAEDDPLARALFEIDNKDRRARVGALVNVGMAGSATVDSAIVPVSALLDRSGTPTVVVKTGPESFEIRAVAPGPKSAGAVGITAGIRAGERVVTEGAMSVLLAAGG